MLLSKLTTLTIKKLSIVCILLLALSLSSFQVNAQTVQSSCVNHFVGNSCSFTIYPIDGDDVQYYRLEGFPQAVSVSTNRGNNTKTYTTTWQYPGTYTLNLRAEPDGPYIYSITVEVHRQVGPVSISGPSLVCQSTSTTAFSASASNASYYSWEMYPAAAGSIRSTDGFVNWNSAFTGNVTIEVYAYGTFGDYKTSMLTVNRQATNYFSASLNAPTVVCEAQAFTISASSNYSAASYSWYQDDSNQVIGTTSSLSVTPQLNSFFRAVITPSASAPCLASYSPVTVNTTLASFYVKPRVNGLHFTGGPTSICTTPGATSQYSASAYSAESYQWSLTPAGAGSISTSGLVSWNSTFNGTATVRVTSNGCGGSQQSLDAPVLVRPIPTASVTIPLQERCSGELMTKVTLGNPNTVSGTTFSWTVSAPNITGATAGSGTFIQQTLLNATTVSQTAVYIITPTANGCTGSSVTHTVTVKPVPLLNSTVNPPTVCNGIDFVNVSYSPSSSIPGSSFSWSRASVPGIVQPGISNTGAISEMLTNNNSYQTPVTYRYTTNYNGCSSVQNVTIGVYPAVTSGNLGAVSAICIGSTPGSLPVSSSAGGNGSYSYQWEQSLNGSTWQNAVGSSTSAQYTPPVLYSSTYYRRKVNSCNASVYTNASFAAVTPASVGGLVSSNAEAFVAASGSLVLSGYTGTIQRWQQKIGNGSWIDVANTSANHLYTNVQTTTYFRGVVKSGTCNEVTSSEVAVVILPAPVISIDGPQAIAPGSSTSVSILPGFYRYQWYRNNELISGATANTLAITKPGEYTVSIQSNATSTPFTTEPVEIFNSLDDDQNLNYIRTIAYTHAGMNGEEDLFDFLPSEYIVNTNYFDGLGRPLQNVTLGGAGSGNDIIQPIEYDAFGREAKKYLQYSRNSRDGRYQPAAPEDQLLFYTGSDPTIAQDSSPFSESIFEPSPLNRVIKQGAPGAAWQPDANHGYASTDHTVKFAYEFNEANEVRLWKYSYPNPVSTTGTISSYGRYYLPNQLFKNKTKDEQQREVITYTDKEGKTILKRVQAKDNPSSINDEEYASTYYVYDDFDNLVYVIPPEANKILKSSSNFTAPTTWVGGSSGLSFQPTLITKTSLTPGYNAGAFSTGSILASQAGWIKMTAFETNTSRMIGLSAINAGNNSTMEFAMELASDAHIYVWEDGIKLDDLGLYSQGTEIMILRETGSTAIKYFVNNIVKKISDKTSANRLYIDLAIDHPGGTIQDLEILPAGDKTIIGNYAFSYVYDARKRMIIKKVPDSSPVYMIYDKRDRLVMIQDGNQRSSKRWSFTKYDALNRPVLTGIYTADVVLTVAEMQKRVDDYYAAIPGNGGAWFESFGTTNPIHGYSNKTFPVEANVNNYLTATYYDNYDIVNNWPIDYTYTNEGLSREIDEHTYTQPEIAHIGVTGLVTATKVKVLDGGVTGGYTWLKSVNYYDNKYRLIQNIADNYLNGITKSTTLYNFTGSPILTNSQMIKREPKWINVAHLTNTGNILRGGSISTETGNGGASSAEALPAGQDGWLSFVTPQTNRTLYVGFTKNDIDREVASMEYAIRLNGASNFYIYESGYTTGSIGSYAAGDVFKIERTGNTIKYYKNDILVGTSNKPSLTNLFADITITQVNAAVANVITSFGRTVDVATRRLDYDHAGRLIDTWHSINGATPILLSHNEYNELGQLIDKKLHSTAADASDAKQSVDYRYNIRGWLESINNAQLAIDNSNDDANDYFGMQLAYNTDLGTGNVGNLQYNGNISATKWSNQFGLNSIKENAYNYTYDAMNRLKTADFRQYVGGTWGLAKYRTKLDGIQSVNAFSESVDDYDLNGNIKSLKRTGQDGQLIDDLTYSYTASSVYYQSNKLLRVTDAANDTEGFVELNSTIDDFVYDNNGNLLYDRNRNTEEVVMNGEFDDGSTNWTSTESPRLTFANGRIEIVPGAAESIITQDVSVKKGTYYVANINLVKTSTTGSLNVRVGGSSTNFTIVASTTLSIFSPSNATNDIKIIATPDFAGYIESISVHAATVITYNYLNLPETVTQGVDGFIQYIYTATGQKLTQIVTEGTNIKTTDYAGEYIYENDVLQFINHEEGRLVPEEGVNTYQYHLKDHLGNVRLTFTTKQEVEEVAAALETEDENEERANFLKYDDIRKVNFPMFDHTTTVTTQYAMRLSGTPAETYGLARSISVMPGDQIKAEVFAKYLDTNPANWTAALTDLMAAIASGGTAPGTVIDGGAYGSPAASSIPFASPLGKSSEPSDIPKAYLNWLVFDKNFVPIASKSGFRRITTAAMENGLLAPEGVPHEKLESPLIEISEPGFVYIYLSNEEPGKEVYFDDFQVIHTKSPVVQSDDYYPFGLTFNSYSRENSLENNFLFNGFEKQNNLDLGIYDYKTRTYDPALGRFMQIDPAADLMRRFSPYAYAFDNPIRFIDPDGMIPVESTDGEGDDDKKKKEEEEKKRQERFEEAKKKGITIYKAQNDATAFDTNQSKAKLLGGAMDRANSAGVNVQGVLSLISKANDAAEIGYETSTTNFRVNNRGGRLLGRAGDVLGLATTLNEFAIASENAKENGTEGNYSKAYSELAKLTGGLLLGPSGPLIESFIAVGEAQMPYEALQHANNSRQYYAKGVMLENQGLKEEANKWYKLSTEEYRRASNGVKYLAPK